MYKYILCDLFTVSFWMLFGVLLNKREENDRHICWPVKVASVVLNVVAGIMVVASTVVMASWCKFQRRKQSLSMKKPPAIFTVQVV